MTRPVSIDYDFLNHLVEIKNHKDPYNLILLFFKALEVAPEMHPLVHEREARPYMGKLALCLFDSGIISVPELSAIWRSQPGGQRYYEIMVRKVYKDFMGEEYPCPRVCIDWKTQSSLGEVHTVVMCAFLKQDCFLSDDKRAARDLGKIVRKILMEPVNILNRVDCCNYLKQEKRGQHNLTGVELNQLGHKLT